MLLFVLLQMAVTMARYMGCLESLQDRSSHIRRSLSQDLRYKKAVQCSVVFGILAARGEGEWPLLGGSDEDSQEGAKAKYGKCLLRPYYDIFSNTELF
jgi:hypothetical protein